ncbi:MAG: hypothetical protein MK078_08760 [Crocinitomicaceae bacterium]|nr:hypothetical protein [Crocinitomicaceae bacterium]
MKKILLILLMAGFAVQAQPDKKIDKCIKVFYKKGMAEGIEKLNKLMDKEMIKNSSMPSLRAYEVLVAMEFERYSLFANMDISITDENGEEDTSMTALFDELTAISETRFLNTCRRATIESTSYTADMYYRNFVIDEDPDTNISEKGLEYYTEAEEFFLKEDYELAELNYRKALNEDPGYYKALLYLGDSFWAREDYDSALVYYTQAKKMHPELLEPRKYIVDALVEQELYFRAKKECLEAFTIFPGADMKLKYQQILYVENKYMDDHRFFRLFYPNDITKEDQDDLSYLDVWADYRAAKVKISKYCSDDGIIEDNGITEDRYLEVYSIRNMLQANKGNLPEYLHFAAKMDEEGYLEPYVMIGLFHVDFYPQFKDYMSSEENREKSMEWVEKYTIETYRD